MKRIAMMVLLVGWLGPWTSAHGEEYLAGDGVAVFTPENAKELAPSLALIKKLPKVGEVRKPGEMQSAKLQLTSL